MPVGILAKALAVAAISATCVWILTVVTFTPWVENRPYCSGGATLPYVSRGVTVNPTLPPHCRFGPVPAGADAPAALPAVVTFLFVMSLGLFVLGAATPGSRDLVTD